MPAPSSPPRAAPAPRPSTPATVFAESEALIAACEDAGIAFVGPHREAIRAMGSKIAAKAIAVEAGVPVVPGYHEEDQRDAVLIAAAERIGFPLLIKASAGGGGRGMRSVAHPGEFPRPWHSPAPRPWPVSATTGCCSKS